MVRQSPITKKAIPYACNMRVKIHIDRVILTHGRSDVRKLWVSVSQNGQEMQSLDTTVTFPDAHVDLTFSMTTQSPTVPLLVQVFRVGIIEPKQRVKSLENLVGQALVPILNGQPSVSLGEGIGTVNMRLETSKPSTPLGPTLAGFPTFDSTRLFLERHKVDVMPPPLACIDGIKT